jgi:predicted nucleotidyltransferase
VTEPPTTSPNPAPTVRRDEALALLRAHQPDLERFRVKSLSVFGSVARDEAGPQSDLDLLVEFYDPATYDLYSGLKMFLEDLLGARVDLVTRKALKPRMRPYVEREAVRVT